MGKSWLTAAVAIVIVVAAAFGLYAITEGDDNSPPELTLVSDRHSGKAPLTVIFSVAANDSDGSIASWKIDLNGDGTPEERGEGTPDSTYLHVYSEQGTYTATVEVQDDDGAVTRRSLMIAVLPLNVPPICDLVASIRSGPSPLNVTFTLAAGDADGTVIHWALAIVLNGTVIQEYSGYGEPPADLTHVFWEAGGFFVDLIVWDEDGAMGYDGIDIHVQSV